jgi:hypothetical protein
MFKRSVIRLYTLAAAALLLAAPAQAQFTPRSFSEPATGESYHIEGSAGFWSPNANMHLSGESLGIPGDNIDFKKDLGLTNQRFKELHLVLKPSRKTKFRLEYIPIRYRQRSTVTRDLVFNGQLYRIGVPVESLIDWKAYRFTYEYDFVSLSRVFGGFILEAKYTDIRAELDSPNKANPTISEFVHGSAPIPAIGGIVRVYVVPAISVTGELSGIKLPKSIGKENKAHFADFDMYGTVNLTPNFGAQLGYRSFDIGYKLDDSEGSFTLKGVYFGAVARY